MELRSESSIDSLRKVEQLEQNPVESGQVGRRAVTCAGELKRYERDGSQGFEQVVAGWASRDVAGQQVGHLDAGAKCAAGGAFEQAEDHERDAQDRDQPDDALIT